VLGEEPKCRGIEWLQFEGRRAGPLQRGKTRCSERPAGHREAVDRVGALSHPPGQTADQGFAVHCVRHLVDRVDE
jgi:hypothetical protein